jgi:AraC-like DNA-binding protein
VQSPNFSHLVEVERVKNPTVQLGGWPVKPAQHLRVLSVLEGKFEWVVAQKTYVLYPHDVVVVCPWHEIGSPTATLEIGSFQWAALQPVLFESDGTLHLGEWSALTETDQRLMGKLLVNGPLIIPNFRLANELIMQIEAELKNTAFAYQTRVNQLLDQLLIAIFRQLSQHQNQRKDFSQAFVELEKMLRNSLDHPWTVEEMAAVVGMGSTAFTEKVKVYSGFSPLNYLINIRISEAMKQMKTTRKSLTDIALDMGFYSSQHFSSTFKKLTGYTPGQYRKSIKETA